MFPHACKWPVMVYMLEFTCEIPRFLRVWLSFQWPSSCPRTASISSFEQPLPFFTSSSSVASCNGGQQSVGKKRKNNKGLQKYNSLKYLIIKRLILYTLQSVWIFSILFFYTFPKGADKENLFNNQELFSWWSFPLFLWPSCVIQLFNSQDLMVNSLPNQVMLTQILLLEPPSAHYFLKDWTTIKLA